jgi:hypothetical protein
MNVSARDRRSGWGEAAEPFRKVPESQAFQVVKHLVDPEEAR